MKSTELQVRPEAPLAIPVVLLTAEAMQAIADLEARAAVTEIVDANTAQEAANALAQATKLANALERSRKEANEPFLKLQRAINDAAKIPASRISAAKARIQTSLTVYNVELERQRKAEEERRRKEAERLERERQEAEAALQREREAEERRAREEAERQTQAEALPEVPFDDEAPVAPFDDEDETPPEPEKSEAAKRLDEIAARSAQLMRRPDPVAAKPTGVQFRVTLTASVVKVVDVPDSLLLPRQVDMVRVRTLYCTGWKDGQEIPKVAGLKFEVNRTPVASGR